jgi:hypothetical protein
MGFSDMALVRLVRDTRLGDRAGTSVALWYAHARWARGATKITDHEPFLFDHVVPVDEGGGAPLPTPGTPPEPHEETHPDADHA